MKMNESKDSIDNPISVCQNSLYKAPEGRTYLKGTKSHGRLHTYRESIVGNHKIEKPLRPVGPRPAHFTSLASENGLSTRAGGVRGELRPSLKPEARRASRIEESAASSSTDENGLDWLLFVVDTVGLVSLLLLFPDSSSTRLAAGALLACLFFTEGPRTITGLAVTLRAIHELLPLTASARASCAGVMAGTAGASAGVIVTVTGESSPGAFADPGPPLWILTTAARVRCICCAGTALTMASLR